MLEFQVIHPLLFCSEVPVLVRYLALGLIKGKLLEGEYGSYHVPAHPFSLLPGLCANPTVYVETGVAPAQHFLHQREVYQLFAEQKRENLPGVSSLPVTALMYFRGASFPQRQRPERSERLYLKNTRSILGMVSTTWRWGTSSTRDSLIHSPHSSRLFEWQEGQNPRTLHEKVNNLSVPQSGQRILANPHFGLPQSRYFSTIEISHRDFLYRRIV